jgi:hypothetical protein
MVHLMFLYQRHLIFQIWFTNRSKQNIGPIRSTPQITRLNLLWLVRLKFEPFVQKPLLNLDSAYSIGLICTQRL